MLAGLQAAAAALNNGQGVAAINRNNLNVSSTRSRFSTEEAGRSPVFDRNSLRTSNTTLNGIPEGARVGDDGTIYEFDEPIGRIEFYNSLGAPMQMAAQTVVASRVGFADLMKANNAINSIIEQRAFEANAHIIGIFSKAIGTTLNMRA